MVRMVKSVSSMGRVGWVVMAVAGVALVYALAQPGRAEDGRVYGPDITLPAAILALGAALVGLAGPKPLDARLARAGMGLVALGAVAIVAIKVAAGSANPMAALLPLVVAIGAFVAGFIAVGLALVRARR